MQYQVVIPVMNESENILGLIRELETLGDEFVIDFIDDSKGMETASVIASARAEVCVYTSIEHFHRIGEMNRGGLAGAVVDGINRSSDRGAQYIVVMDGDGQHDPSFIPDMLEKLRQGYDIVASTRYAHGGSNVGLDGAWRHFVSKASAWISKVVFPKSLKSVTDPGTGFFAFSANAIDTSLLNAVGFKLLFEILVSHRGLQVSEVPIVFRPREKGESKGTFARGMEFLMQLARLRLKYWSRRPKALGTTLLETSAS